MDDKTKLLIESYLTGELSTEEVQDFEARLSKDESLRNEVALVKDVNQFLTGEFTETNTLEDEAFSNDVKTALKSDEIKALKETLLEVKEEYHSENQTKKNKINFFLVAASVALLIIGAYTLNFFNQPNAGELYASYYSKTDLPAVIKRGDNQSFYEKGVIAFNNKDYNKAIEFFNSYKNNTDFDSSVFLYMGTCYSNMKDNEKAHKVYDNLINSNSINRPKGIWFKALLYIKSNEFDKAKTTLESLLKDNSKYKHKEALALLKEIE